MSEKDNAALETGFHRHEHSHEAQPPHRHVHHHVVERAGEAPHEHAHATGFERLTYLSSPMHARDARAKVVSAAVLVVAVVATHVMGPGEFVLVVALLLAVTVLSRLPLAAVLRRTALVLPFAGAIAVFAPLQAASGSLDVVGGTVWYAEVLGVMSKAWLSVFVMVLLSATTPVPDLLAALRRFRVPHVFLLLLAFIYRYVAVLGDQIRAMRTAVSSRAPGLSRLRSLTLFGHLAGSMFIRAYERGERIHAAMLARGFDGTLPTRSRSRLGAADALLVATAALAAAAIALA
ncbi:MAG: cobalt ECF transporter T component CbiQ [Coriobacteriia bacterium]